MKKVLITTFHVGAVMLLMFIPLSLQAAESNGRSIDYITGVWPSNVQTVTPGLCNELGIDEAVSHVSDLSAYWTYTSLHYYRLTNKGTFGARVNSAHRFGKTAVQYQAEAYPIFRNGVYAVLTAAYANKTQTLFATYQYRAEIYFPLPHTFEISLGQAGQHFPRFENQSINLYTASLGKYYKNYFAWIRPYYYTPQSNFLCEIGLRKTFDDPNTFVAIRASNGTLPDIGDLPPISNLITLHETAVGLSGQLPLPHHFFIKPDISYEHQRYPGGHIRNIATVFIGLFLRFN